MTILIATTVGAKKDTGRIWLEGTKLERAGFAPQTPYEVKILNGTLYLQRTENAERKVSGRRTGEIVKPIIELCNKVITDTFGIGTKLLAIVKNGKIAIRRAVQPLFTMEREQRFLKKLRNGEVLDHVGIFHGGGVMDRALHDGLAAGGIKSRMSVIAELDGNYIDASLRANPELFDDTLIINGPIQAFSLGKVKPCEIMSLGLPCTGASLSGRAKRRLTSAEAHPEAGALFFTAMQLVDKFKPAIVEIENVPTYQNTASMDVIRSLLSGWGYEVHEAVLNGVDYGSLENRNRLVVIAISKGLAEAGFSMDWITPTHTKPATVAEVLEPITEDDESWRTFEYLEAKQERDIANGKGFRRQLYAADADAVNTITRDYQKARSTDPFLRHPTNPKLSRLFTPVEHGRIKGLPEGWVESLKVSATVAHQILGQGVVYPVFHAVGHALARWFATVVRKLAPAADSAPVPAAAAA